MRKLDQVTGRFGAWLYAVFHSSRLCYSAVEAERNARSRSQRRADAIARIEI